MAFKKIYTEDKNLQQVQDNVDDALRPLQSLPLSKAVLVSNISLTSGQDNLVPHGLNKAPLLWILAAQNTNSRVWSQNSSQLNNQSSNERLINIRCSTTCVVNLLFS